MASTPKPEETNEFLELLGDLWKYKFAVAFFLLLSGLFGVFAAYWIRPVYEVNALLQIAVSYTHLRAHETPEHLVCRILLAKKKNKQQKIMRQNTIT